MNITPIRYYILTFCLLLCAALPAKSFSHYFRQYTINEGLSNNAVYSVFQDSKGRMWFGTIDGLHSFDGQRIKVWRNDSEDISLGNIIYSIAEDDKQCLWIASDAGLALLNLRTEEFIPFKASTHAGSSVRSCVSDVYLDSRKNMWISTIEQGVFCYNLASGVLRQFTAPNQLPSDRIKDIMEDKSGVIWITTLYNGICSYNPASGKFKCYKGEQCERNLILFEDSHANLWVGNAGQGLFLLDRKTGRFEQKIKPESNQTLLQIRSIVEWQPGILLLASDEGMITYRVEDNTWKVTKSSNGNYGGLNDNYLHYLFIDRENGLWVGTYFGGVNYMSPTNSNFTYYNTTNTAINGKVVSAFARDSKDNLWIGTDDAGFFYWDRKADRYISYKPKGDNHTPTYQNIHALLQDNDRLYIGMYMGGLDILDLKTGIFQNYNTSESLNSLYSSGVYALYKDSYGDIWVGTTLGLNRFQSKTNDFERVFEVHPADVTCIVEDRKGYLWVSSSNKGVFRYERKTGKWKNYRHVTGDTRSLPTDKVITLSVDYNQRLWLGTDGKGLCRYDYEADNFEKIPFSDPSIRVIHRILPDNEHLWITTSSGLLKFQLEQGILKVYNKYDGLQDNQFSPNAGIRMDDGTMYVGGINGFNAFRPAEMVQNNEVPTVILTDFLLFNKHVNTSTEDSPLSASITYTDKLVLNKSHSIFSLEFAVLSYTGAEKNRYKYKLEGFEKEWTELTGAPRVTYTNLSPGNYVFRVIASNGDGVWNEEGITLPIKVLPPWWLSYPALAGYFLMFIGLIYYSFYRMRRQHRKKLAYMAAQKDKELYNSKIDFFTHIVHEIRTPLTLILAPLDNIMKSAGTVKEALPQLQVVERNGKRLLTLVNQLMDFRKVEEGGMEIHCRATNINRLLEDVYKRFKLSAELKNIRVSLNLPSEECLVSIDPEAFTKIVSNLLSNALKFTTDYIEIRLTLDAEKQRAELTVRDNGCGINIKEQQEIFKPFYQVKEDRPSDCIGTGIGLLLVKKLVEMMQGELRLESEVGSGSAFIVTFATTAAEVGAEKQDETIPQEVETSPEAILPLKQNNTVLIVDDNPDLLSFLHDLFNQDYKVIGASNGQEALQLLAEDSVDLIISDVMMPGMDGFEFCGRIKNNLTTSHIPVMLLTAKVAMEDHIEGLETGADIYVEKPFSAEVLKAQVRSLLDNRERLRRNYSATPSMPIASVATSRMDEEFLARMSAIIEQNMTNPDFTVETLAQELCMGRSNFFAKVKGISGMTPNDMIRVIRLKKAAELFASGESCISDVCFRVGFSSPSYFAKCFQMQFGVSPTEFLKKGLRS